MSEISKIYAVNHRLGTAYCSVNSTVPVMSSFQSVLFAPEKKTRGKFSALELIIIIIIS